MAHLRVHSSSSLVRLADALSERLATEPAPPLSREPIVILSNGMGRWLSMQLAASRGVAAGLDFRFPNDTMDDCIRAVIPDLPDSSLFSLDTMAWRIAGILPACVGRTGFEPVTAYLGDRDDDRRLLQLSRTLADCFDQYTIFRPEMVLQWDTGRDDFWQAQLWRELTAGASGLHRAALLRRFRAEIASGPPALHRLPRRITLFGISFLPPFHLEFFSILSRHAEVDIYLQNPCGGYWGDLTSPRRRAELALDPAIPPEALEFYETGTPLLSSLGTQGQEFIAMLLDRDPEWLELDSEQPPVGTTLLGMLQGDILNLRDRTTATADRGIIDADDRSIQIHSCHGPLREMETLYDNLLALFDKDPGLEPRDICVMTPDIETFAPYIEATFGTRSGGRPAIPYTIADRNRRRENPLLDRFLKILDLPAGRFGITAMLEIMECPQVMARFDIDADELALIRTLLKESGVRWGMDAEHRSSLGFPPYDDFSWQHGLDRLLLGYALQPAGDRLFAGIMPAASPGGLQAQTLGKLSAFLGAVRPLAERLSGRRTLAAWAGLLEELTRGMMTPLDGNDTSLTPLYAAFQELRDTAARAGFSLPLSLDAVRDTLAGLFSQGSGASGFLGGRVTFCSMLPMRSIPMRVVCLVGMCDGVFPRNRRPPPFSLMNGPRLRGDRSIRDEDRYLFLEALMSAGETIYISYTGQSNRDNGTLPPSVVVSELLDYIRGGFRGATDGNPPRIVTRHRLQSFSEAYFTEGSELFSYAMENRSALELRHSSGPLPRTFIHAPLEDTAGVPLEVDLQQLIRFLHNPARHFLSRRMNVSPFDPSEELMDQEPFALDPLGGYSLKQELCTRILNGEPCGDLFEAVRAAGRLPSLGAGKMIYERTLADCVDFAARVAPRLSGPLDDLPVERNFDDILLTGVLTGVCQERHLRWRCAGMKGKDRLAIWCEHLLLNALRPAGYPRESMLICTDLTLTLPPLDNAPALLFDLLTLYRTGLGRPLPFFPQSSWLFVSDGIAKAEDRWNGTDYQPTPAESSDPSQTICFAGSNALNDEFMELASRVYGPLLQLGEEKKNA